MVFILLHNYVLFSIGLSNKILKNIFLWFNRYGNLSDVLKANNNFSLFFQRHGQI